MPNHKQANRKPDADAPEQRRGNRAGLALGLLSVAVSGMALFFAALNIGIGYVGNLGVICAAPLALILVAAGLVRSVVGFLRKEPRRHVQLLLVVLSLLLVLSTPYVGCAVDDVLYRRLRGLPVYPCNYWDALEEMLIVPYLLLN